MTTTKRVKDRQDWHHGRIVRMGGCESLVLAPEIAKAAGLAWGDEVRATVERGRLVIERLRSATSPEDVALGLLRPDGVSTLGVAVMVQREHANLRFEEVLAALDALVADGRARVEHLESVTPRGRRVRSSRYYPVGLPQTAPLPRHPRMVDREVLDAAKARRERAIEKSKTRPKK